MHKLTGILLCSILATISLMANAETKSRSVGSTYSFAGIGVVYELNMDEISFIELQIRAETAPLLFTYGTETPGISASFTWNMIFAEIESVNGNKISFFAGPGAATGIAEDLKGNRGIFFGLKGRIGGECIFPRKVALSISLSPILGAHIGKTDRSVSMLPYRFGLLSAFLPEVGIKYAF